MENWSFLDKLCALVSAAGILLNVVLVVTRLWKGSEGGLELLVGRKRFSESPRN